MGTKHACKVCGETAIDVEEHPDEQGRRIRRGPQVPRVQLVIGASSIIDLQPLCAACAKKLANSLPKELRKLWNDAVDENAARIAAPTPAPAPAEPT